MPFRNLLGQEKAIHILQGSIKSGRLSHAYLFKGPDGVGKSSAAKSFLQALNCGNGEVDGCGRCSSCQRIERLSYPDLKWMEPRGASRSLRIEKIRELQREISLKPIEGKWKAYVLLEAERMTIEAQNALLKTLEEPPSFSLIILISSNPSLLSPTILSRCQMVRFSQLKRDEIERILVGVHKLPPQRARLLASLSQGSPGKALRMELEEREEVLSILERIHSEDAEGIFLWVDGIMERLEVFRKGLEERMKEEFVKVDLPEPRLRELKEEGKAFVRGEYRKRVSELLETIALWYRDLLVVKGGGSPINVDREEELRRRAQSTTVDDLERSFRLIEETNGLIDRNVNLRLSLEVLLLGLRETKDV